MADLGAKISYLALRDGTAVYDRDGDRVGVVEHVLADEGDDIFHGVVLQTPPPSGRHLFAYRDQIDNLHEHGVVLSVRGGELPEPGEDAPARDAAEGPAQGLLKVGLRRAWEWIRQPR